MVVIGASAGGVEALQQVCAGLPASLNAAVLVVMHTSANSGGLLANILNRVGPLKAITPLDGERIESATLSLPACNGCDGIHSERDDFETSPLLTIGGTTLRLNVVDCPPKGTSELDRANLWRRGETAKKDCPIAC